MTQSVQVQDLLQGFGDLGVQTWGYKFRVYNCGFYRNRVWACSIGYGVYGCVRENN